MIEPNRRVVVAGLATFIATPALAAWPERSITITHGLGPGGGVDSTARILAEPLSLLPLSGIGGFANGRSATYR
jgi:tripartite-type tricarboxylate transporter receptor subunit TctC